MEEATETKYCSNCKRDIASANFLMHEVHCRRNIVLCKQCQEPVPKAEMDAHVEEMHAKEPCSLCGKSFEKCQLEDHKVDCPQRPQQCAYCELEMAFSELAAHHDYCGTRTEHCARCSQYIMVKDQARHEDTNCAYPTPKPKNTAARNLPENAHLYDVEPPEYSSFALDELNRMLHSDIPNNIAMGNPRANRQRQNVASRERLGLHQNRSNPVRTNNLPRNNAARTRLTKQKNTPPPRRVESDEELSPHRPVPDAELDQLLARHLAEDLAESEDWGVDPHSHNLLREDVGEAPLQPRPVSLLSQPPELEDESVSIPCEFCGDAFPIEVLLDHQELCHVRLGMMEEPSLPALPQAASLDLDGANAFQDALDDIVRRGETTPNNATSPLSSGPSSQPQIVNNLSYLEAHNRFSGPLDSDSLDEDEVFLPCEFCDQLFPQENLVQHQTICDSNSTFTPPRSQSPPMNHTALDYSRPARNNGADHQRAVRGRVFKRQPESSYQSRNSVVNGASSRHGDLSPQDKNHRGSYQPRSSNYAARNGRYDRPANFTGNLSSPGVGKPKNMPSPDTPSPTEGPEQRRRGSAARVRDTLDHLLEDPTYTNRDLANYVDKQSKSAANLQRQAQHTGSNTGSRRELMSDETSYQASFAAPSVSQYSRKPRTKPIAPRVADPGIPGSDSLRYNVPEGASNQGIDDNTSHTRSSYSNRPRGGKKSTRPRRHPQGDA